LVFIDGKPKYVTTLGTGNTHKSWRDDIVKGGVLIDVETNEIILKGLTMPHSPRMYNEELYMCLSASGEIIKVNVQNKSYTVLKGLGAFVRGMAIHNEYLFVGVSNLRKKFHHICQTTFC
jgi:uncharacterized protein (TIGR03032 family)